MLLWAEGEGEGGGAMNMLCRRRDWSCGLVLKANYTHSGKIFSRNILFKIREFPELSLYRAIFCTVTFGEPFRKKWFTVWAGQEGGGGGGREL